MPIVWVLQSFVASGDPLADLWRPLFTITGASLVLVLATAIAARRSAAGYLLVAALISALLRAWPLLAAIVVVVGWRTFVDWSRRCRGLRPLRERAGVQVARILNGFVLILLVLSAGGLTLSGAAAFPHATARVDGSAASGPNVYLVLLDGYPRADTVAALGFDNAAFLTGLERRGFEVAAASHSNYNKTLLTLASMFNGDYLEPLGEAPLLSDRLAWAQRQLADRINSGAMLADLRSHGYAIANSPSAFGSAALYSADRVYQHGTLTQFDERLLRQSFARDLLTTVGSTFIEDQLRERTLDTIRDVEDAAAAPPRTPFFLFAHLLSPHPPFLFGADGSARSAPWCYERGCSLWTTQYDLMGMSRSEYADLLSGQIEYLNGRLLAMVDRISAADPTGVVILFSDHGARFDPTVTQEYFETFFAARTPGRAGVFPSDVSPVNVLPLLLDSYLRESIPTNEYRSYVSDLQSLDFATRQ